MRRKSGKVSQLPPVLSQGLTSEPGDHPDHIHCHGCEEVLEVRTRQADVATLAETKAPDALREAAFHPRPERILGFELGRCLALACLLDRLVIGSGPDGELPGGVFRRGAHLTSGTGATGGPVKADPKHRIA
jgi:hypothetical protein